MYRARALLLREDGMGLLELVITTAIVGVLLAMASMVFASTVRHTSRVTEENITQTQLRAVVGRLRADLRGAAEGTPPLASIGPAQLTFFSPDHATPHHLRRISYRLNGGRLERASETSTDTDGAPWVWPGLSPYTPQLRHVVNTAPFKYLKAGGAETLDPAAARTVVITLTVSPFTSNGRQYTYRTSVTLRSTQ